MTAAPVAAADRMRLEGIAGRTAVVTGASSGIGLRVAETLSALGARVAGIDLTAASPALDLGIVADVCDEGEIDAAFSRIERELGQAEILVTSAGVFVPTPIDELDAASFRRTVEINLTGTFLSAQRALAPMRAGGFGRIVTLTSAAGIDGGGEACADYAASKGGVIALTKALARESVADGVTVNTVAPRNIRTPMLTGMEAELVAIAPSGRIGEPDEVAAAVVFLCSAHASYMSGEVMVVNGGWW